VCQACHVPEPLPPEAGRDYVSLQRKLSGVHAISTPESTTPHALVILPSFNISESLLAHYETRFAAYEHRFLVALFVLRMPAVRVAYVCSVAPAESVLDYYFSLLPESLNARDRFRVVVVDDEAARPVCAKLLERPDLLAELTEWVGGDPAFIEPWNVAEPEQKLALTLDLPILGSAPDLWALAFKSAGKKLFREAEVPAPAGFEDLETVSDAVDAIERLRADDPNLPAVILKHDDSGGGDGNAVIRTDDLAVPGSSSARRRLRSRVNRLESWYLNDLALGFVAEARIVGEEFSSPSAQVDVNPDGTTSVVSTHEQILAEDGQVYLGCRFPADSGYAAELGDHALAVADVLAQRGALGRIGIDFVTARSNGGPWSVHAIEINLRKPATTHPYVVLRHLAPGRYAPDTGRYTDDTGQEKFYVASDNVVHENWTGIPEGDVIDALVRAGIGFDTSSRTGVVPHMLSCIAVDGRFGITAIGNTRQQADELHNATSLAVHELVGGYD